MTSVEQQAAEVIENMGTWLSERGLYSNQRDQVALIGLSLHIARALAEHEPPLLAPELPSDDTVGMSGGEWSAGFEWEGETRAGIAPIHKAHTYAFAPGKIGLVAPRIMTTDHAEGLALAILAAVRSDRQIAAAQAEKENKS